MDREREKRMDVLISGPDITAFSLSNDAFENKYYRLQ